MPDINIETSSIQIPTVQKPENPEGYMGENGILVPESYGSSIITPKPSPALTEPKNDKVLLPSKEDLLSYAKPEGEKPKENRSISDIAFACMYPTQFLMREVKETLKNSSVAGEICRNLEEVSNNQEKLTINDPTQYIAQSETHKKIEASDYAEKNPSPLEEACMTLISISTEPVIKETATQEVALKLAGGLLNQFRNQALKTETLPEMGHLVSQIIAKVEAIPRKSLKYVYEILDNIPIPLSQIEPLLQELDLFKDLDEPLAFKLELELAKSNPNSQWLHEQAERRALLLEELSKRPQEIFDNYKQLIQMIRGVVYSGDILDISDKKVGLEIEFGMTNLPIRKIPPGFSHHIDDDNLEITKDDNSLNYGLPYLKSLQSLRRWLGDNADFLSSLHIHLDTQEYKGNSSITPYFFSPEDQSYRVNGLGTHEFRGQIIPLKNNNLDIAKVADLINMYTHSFEGSNNIHKYNLKINENFTNSLDQILFTSIVVLLDNPEARLAALKSMENPMTLKGFNPFIISRIFPNDIETISNLVQRDKYIGSIVKNIMQKLSEKSLNEIIRDRNIDSDLRVTVIRALGNNLNESSIQELRTLIRDGNIGSYLRETAIEALGNNLNESDIQELRTLIRDGNIDRYLRETAIRALGNNLNESSIQELRTLIRDKGTTTDIKVIAIEALGNNLNESDIQELRSIVRDENIDDDLRVTAIRALGNNLNESSIQELRTLIRDGNIGSYLRETAIRALGNNLNESSIQELRTLIRDGNIDSYLRVTAIRALGNNLNESDIQELRTLIRDGNIDSYLRVTAIRALGNNLNESDIQELRSIVRDENIDDDLRVTAIRALGNNLNESDIQELRTLIRDKGTTTDIKVIAIRALGNNLNESDISMLPLSNIIINSLLG